MLIQRFFQKALEEIYAFDRRFTLFNGYDLDRLRAFYFHEDHSSHSVKFSHQIAHSNYWNTLTEGQYVGTMKSYFLDWYESHSYRIEVVEDFLAKIEATVQENLPHKPEKSFPDQILFDHPTEAGVLVRVIVRRVLDESPQIRSKHLSKRLVESKEPLLKVIRKMKADAKEDKRVRAIDQTARLTMLTGLKKFEKQMSKASLHKLVKRTTLLVVAYGVLRTFGVKFPPLLPPNPPGL